jgi:hypothetical protein
VYQIVSNLPFALDIQYTAVTAKLFYAFSWALCKDDKHLASYFW